MSKAESERSGSSYALENAWASTPVDDSGYQSIHLSQLGKERLKAKPERYKVGDVIGGRYAVLDIHRGSMGVIYATYDRVEKLPRALKTLQQRFAHIKEMQQMFIEEASVWVRIEKHPFIVRAYLVDIFEGQPFVITEYIRGKEGLGNDLRAWLGKPELTLEVTVELALQVAQALQHATRKVNGLVHRDLKPGNVLIDERRRALVADFGLVYANDSRSGTPAYMAPEQWLRQDVTMQTDIYAYGCILYEMLTGHRLFKAQTINDWQQVHVNHEPVMPSLLNPGISEGLEKFVMRCLAKDTGERPESWEEVVEECSTWYRQLTGLNPRLDFSTYDLKGGELVNASYSLTQLGKYKEVLEVCDRALLLNANNTTALYNKGIALGKIGRYEQAVAAYERILALDPSDAGALYHKGNALMALGRYDQAVTAYADTLAVNKEDAAVWYNKALALNHLGQHEQALDACLHALRIDPENAAAWQNKGNALIALEKYDEAVEAYQNAITLDSTDLDSWYNLGNALMTTGRHEEAVEAYDNVLNVAPNDPGAWNNKGRRRCRL